VRGNIRLIGAAKKEVQTDIGVHPYDFLVSALGCRAAPEEVEGMAEQMGNGVHTFYTLDGTLAMQKPLAEMTEGHLVIDIAEMPIKCPVASLEFAFFADYFFRQKGIRDRIEISLVLKAKRLNPFELFGGHRCKDQKGIAAMLAKAREIEAERRRLPG
jgi:sulfide:quinone oxidoreductase